MHIPSFVLLPLLPAFGLTCTLLGQPALRIREGITGDQLGEPISQPLAVAWDGCLGLDAMWQLVGFYLGWLGNPGKGRALGVSAVKFTGEVLKNVKNVRYEIDIKKIMAPGGTTVGLANGLVFADDKKIYSADSLKVGLFK